MSRIEEIKTQLAAYRDGLITYDREHVTRLQEERLRLEKEAKGVKCPKCGSTDIAGLIAAFYVPLDANGEPKGQWTEWQSNTELTPSRSCASCNHEWESDE